jgi:hypothetical protein
MEDLDGMTIDEIRCVVADRLERMDAVEPEALIY